MNIICENDVVALLVDQPAAGLQRGDVGTVIQVFESTADHPAGLIVEFVDEFGKVQAQTDITDLSQIVKLRYRPVMVAA
jgi:alpha-D-ribose 1-methylphosphonate 5-triphosphate synthase subunit PhnL